MIKVTVIAVGKLKEKYLRDACEEYLKRLGTYSKVSVVEVNEERCSDNPSESEIENVKQKRVSVLSQKFRKARLLCRCALRARSFQARILQRKLRQRRLQGTAI